MLLVLPCAAFPQDDPEEEGLDNGLIIELTEEGTEEEGPPAIAYGGDFEGVVTSVIDAAHVEIDGERMELIGVHPPAGGGCFAEESRAYLGSRLLEKRVSYSFERTNGHRRVLGDRRIYLYEGNRMLNSELIRAGMAFSDRRPSYPEEESFVELQEGARRRHAGLWRTCPVECNRFGDCNTKSW